MRVDLIETFLSKVQDRKKKQQMLSIFVNCCFVILRKLMQNTFDSCVSVD